MLVAIAAAAGLAALVLGVALPVVAQLSAAAVLL
jgi:hypothetical protein